MTGRSGIALHGAQVADGPRPRRPVPPPRPIPETDRATAGLRLPSIKALARWKCPRGYVDNVAAAIVLAVTDDRAAGQVYNIAEPIAFTEAEWVHRIGEVAGWRGEVVTVPRNRIPLPYRVEQSLDTDSGRIRRELGYAEPVEPATCPRTDGCLGKSQPARFVSGVWALGIRR